MDKGVRESQALLRASQRLVDRSNQRIRDTRKLMKRALHVQRSADDSPPPAPRK
jgi:hypothetical protein